MRKIVSLMSTKGKHLALLTMTIFLIEDNEKPTGKGQDKQLLLAGINFPIRM